MIIYLRSGRWIVAAATTLLVVSCLFYCVMHPNPFHLFYVTADFAILVFGEVNILAYKGS